MKRTIIIVAALAFLGLIILNNNIQKQEIALKVQKMDLDQMKVDVADATQKTHEMSTNIEKSRQLLEEKIASWDKKFKESKTQIGSKREQAVKKILIESKREQAVKKTQIESKHEQTVKKIQIGSKPEQTVKKIQIGSKPEQTVKKTQIESKREQTVKKTQIGSKPEQTVKKTQIGSKPEKTVKEKLEFNYTKISKELHPSLDLSCTHNIINSTKTIKNVVIIDCIFKNIGVHKVYIAPLGITMFEHMEQKKIDNGIESTDHLYPMISEPDNDGKRSQYKITLTEYGAARLEKGYSLKISFKASTVESGLDAIKRKVKGAIKDNKLKEMSEFDYHYVIAL